MNAWEEGHAAVGRAIGVDEPSHEIVRVEARPSADLIWSVETSSGPSWFRTRPGELEVLLPAEDDRLPVASELAQQEIWSWRPGRRAVWPDRDGVRVWKATRARRDSDAVDRLTRARRALARDRGFAVPRVVTHDSKRAAFAMERIEGRSLPIESSASECWRDVGRGIAAMQESIPADRLAPHGAGDELEVLLRLRGRCEQAAESMPEGLDATLDLLRSTAEGVPATRPVATHRDLHDGQLLADGDRIWLLDLDLLCAADPALDVGNLMAHLVLRSLQDGGGADLRDASAAASAVLMGLEPVEVERFHGALRFYQAAAYARLALVYWLRPRWRALSAELLAHANAAAKEVVFA